MQTIGHRFVSLPVPITGPVGRPVVDPPGGSSETASTALLFAKPASSVGSVSVTAASARNGRQAGSARELGDARGIGAEGCGDDSDGATFQVDGRHEMPLAAAFDRCDERLLLRERAEINQCCDAGRRRALAARLNPRQNARGSAKGPCFGSARAGR